MTSCTSPKDKRGKNSGIPPSITFDKILQGITVEQQSAFDALNELQMNKDEQNHLYSTFAGIVHSRFPADSQFTISRSEMRNVMHQFVAMHCTKLSQQVRDELVELSVLAQEEYVVFHCADVDLKGTNHLGLSMTGTWVIPEVLERRDIVLVW